MTPSQMAETIAQIRKGLIEAQDRMTVIRVREETLDALKQIEAYHSDQARKLDEQESGFGL